MVGEQHGTRRCRSRFVEIIQITPSHADCWGFQLQVSRSRGSVPVVKAAVCTLPALL